MFHIETLASLVDFHVMQDVAALVVYGVLSTVCTAFGQYAHRKIRHRQHLETFEGDEYDAN